MTQVQVSASARPVVVGVDGSDSALRAVEWAAGEAVRCSATLRVVGAFAFPAGRPGRGPVLGEDYRATMSAAAREHVVRAAARSGSAAPATVVEQRVRTGAPAEVLIDESSGARLLVVGHLGGGGLSGLLLGSVGLAVAARAACPVVVVRGERTAGDASAPVVVGVDGSPISGAVLAFAAEAAVARGATLVVVHTWFDGMLDPMVAQTAWAPIEADEQQDLDGLVADCVREHPGLQARAVVAADRPARVLSRWSVGAQLVVVGSRGRGVVAGTLLGSVSQQLLQHADCPVAVVPPAAGERQ